MGFLSDIGGALGMGGQKGPMTTPPINGMGGMADPDMKNPLSAIIGGMTPPDANSDAGADEVVRGFKPKKANFWDRFRDGMLMQMGHKPVHAQRIERENMQAAMEGFTQDPVTAIRRIGAVDPKMAWEVLNQYNDNQRADVVAGIQRQKAEDDFRDNSAAMLGAAKDPETYKRTIGIIRTIAERRGYDVSDFSEEYDPTEVGIRRAGAMTVDQQEDNLRDEAGDANLAGYRATRLNQMERDTRSKIGDRAARLGETGRHNRVMEARPVGGSAAAPSAKGNSPPPQPPKRAGQVAKNNDTGEIWVSRDGKTWVKK